MNDEATRVKHRAWMQHCANQSRDTADEMARMYDGCDDPLHPWNHPSEFRDWQDFVDRVARPIADADSDDAWSVMQAAMRLYRTVNPHYICTALVMMDNRLKSGEPAATTEVAR